MRGHRVPARRGWLGGFCVAVRVAPTSPQARRGGRANLPPKRRATVTAGESQQAQTGPPPKTNWLPLVALAIAQFVMVLDQSAMNVSISALVADFDTTVTTIQAVITLLLPGDGDVHAHRRQDRRHHRPAQGVRGGPDHLRLRVGGDGGGAVGGHPDPGLVGPGGARCRAGVAGDGGADRGQLPGRLAQGGVRA